MSTGYISTNLVKTLYDSNPALIVVSSEDATYTKASLVDVRINKPFRFTGKTDESIRLDFAGAQTVTFLAILSHNFTASVTLTLSAGTTNACSDFSQNVPYCSQNIYLIIAQQIYQYWKLRVQDTTNPGNPEICELYLGYFAAFTSIYSFGRTESRIYINDAHQTEFGTLTTYERFNRRAYQLPWNTVSKTVKNELATMVHAVRGNLNPFVFVPDSTEEVCIFGRITNNFSATASPAPYYSSTIEIVEESEGKTVAP